MKTYYLIVLIAALGLTGCMTTQDEETTVPISEVPAPVLEAAREAVKDIELTEAEMEEEDGQLVYEIDGRANGKDYSIEVTADGNVLEVEED